MLTEILLARQASRLTQRYLTFEEAVTCSPPPPDCGARYLLYIHIPFCEELCPFCSFVRIRFEPSLARAYFKSLKKEIQACHDRGYRFDSVYVGGGTPTVMPAELADVVTFARRLWPIGQVSVETNPNHLVRDTLSVLRDMGTNRLSVGVQSFDDTILEDVRRRHKYGCAETIRRRLGAVIGMFDTVNVDMIFNFPGQTERMLAADVEAVAELAADQVTWYPLMLSETKKQQFNGGDGRIDFARERRLYEMLVDGLADAYRQESVWCFSKKAGLIDEYPVTHEEYLGVGPGALGYVDGTLCVNTFSITDYIRRVDEHGFSLASVRRFSPAEQMRFDLLLKLLSGRMDIRAMREKHGRRLWLHLWPEMLFLLATRAAVRQNGHIALTRKGRYYWLTVMRTLFSMLGQYRDSHADPDSPTPNAPNASEALQVTA
jgi:coproporphyrinogen III oxidase-like Fe-S oxidoreductase